MNLFKLALVFLVGILAACSKQEPLTALDRAVLQLEQAISERQTGKAAELLHEDFASHSGMDKREARQTMTGMFLRYKNVGLLVIGRDCQLDKGFYDRGHCTARVGVSGAQGLIPERAELYQVQTTWQLNGKEWRLLSIQWQ